MKEEYYGALFNDDKIRIVVERFKDDKILSEYFLELADTLSRRGLNVELFFIFIRIDSEAVRNRILTGNLYNPNTDDEVSISGPSNSRIKT